jgi:dTDP-glucose pyrophosphorylase
MVLTLGILAAGMGSRYGGLKQMDPVGPSGEFLLDYGVHDAVRAGFGRVVFVVRRAIADDFRALVQERIARHVETAAVFQELTDLPRGFSVPEGRGKPWGTGHALLCAGPAVHGPFVVVNADDFYGRQSYALLAGYLRDTAADGDAYAMIGFPLRDTLSAHGPVARAICRTGRDGLLLGADERVALSAGTLAREGLTGDETVSMNIWAFKPSIFGRLESHFGSFLRTRADIARAEFFIPDVVNALVQSGAARVKVLKAGDSWMGMTNREDRGHVAERIRRMVQAGEYPQSLWEGGESR